MTSVDPTDARRSATPESADIREDVGYSGMQRAVMDVGPTPAGYSGRRFPHLRLDPENPARRHGATLFFRGFDELSAVTL
jgi:hypothetical protein